MRPLRTVRANHCIHSQRHMSWIGHNAMADMITLYLREQTCEMKRRRGLSLPTAKGRWPKEDMLGKIPRLSGELWRSSPAHLGTRARLTTDLVHCLVWEPYSNDKQPRVMSPSCAFMGGQRKTLKAHAELTDLSWHVEKWNGKEALASHEVGARISFPFKGSRVGVFIYQSTGKGHSEKPGQVGCWVDGHTDNQTILNAWIPDGPSGSLLQLVKKDLDYGEQ